MVLSSSMYGSAVLTLLLSSIIGAHGLTLGERSYSQNTGPSSWWHGGMTSCAVSSYQISSTGSNGTVWPYRKYKTTPVTVPNLNITSHGQPLTPGFIFSQIEVSLKSGENQNGAYILTDTGDLIWGIEGETSNFRMQTWNNNPVITYWVGDGSAAEGAAAGHGYGEVRILNTKYDLINVVCPKIKVTLPPGTSASCYSDVHESEMTDRNTMLVTVYNITTADLTSVGGPKNGWVYDPLAIEVDLSNNETLFVWSPLAHVPINTTQSTIGTSGTNSSDPFDWFHMNSIQLFDGHYYINSRNTWTSYYVNSDGKIEWEIQGSTGGDFGSLPAGGNFTWAHHARLHNVGNQVVGTWFADNNGELNTHNDSVALGLTLALPPSKSNSPKIWSHRVDTQNAPVTFAEGSYQLLPDGHALVGYGTTPVWKEFNADLKGNGEAIWSAQFGTMLGGQTYRAFKNEWSATPSTRIALVVGSSSDDKLRSCSQGSSLRGYVSWNGITDAVTYTVWTGTGATNLRPSANFTRQGFETAFVLPENTKCVKVTSGKASSTIVMVP